MSGPVAANQDHWGDWGFAVSCFIGFCPDDGMEALGKRRGQGASIARLGKSRV